MTEPAVRIIPAREIKPIDGKTFGQGAELKERLKTILKDVPALHERLTKAAVEFERINTEFKATTERAKAIVDEWEKLNQTGA